MARPAHGAVQASTRNDMHLFEEHAAFADFGANPNKQCLKRAPGLIPHLFDSLDGAWQRLAVNS